MVIPRGRWISLVTFTCCLAVFLSQVAARVPPVTPGPNASEEEVLQYLNEVKQYLNTLNRPRFGKRSSSHTLYRDQYMHSDP